MVGCLKVVPKEEVEEIVVEQQGEGTRPLGDVVFPGLRVMTTGAALPLRIQINPRLQHGVVTNGNLHHPVPVSGCVVCVSVGCACWQHVDGM